MLTLIDDDIFDLQDAYSWKNICENSDLLPANDMIE